MVLFLLQVAVNQNEIFWDVFVDPALPYMGR